MEDVVSFVLVLAVVVLPVWLIVIKIIFPLYRAMYESQSLVVSFPF